SVLLGGREVLAAFEALHCVARDRRIDPHPVEAVRTLDRSVHGPPPVRSCVPTTRATEIRYTDTALTHTLKGDLLHKSYARSKRFAGKQFPTIHVRTAAPPDMLVPPAESQVRPGRVPPMKRLAGIALVLGVLAAAAAWSGNQPAQPTAKTSELQVALEERNPWSNLRLNNEPETFRFAIVSDRTGGPPAPSFFPAHEPFDLMPPA